MEAGIILTQSQYDGKSSMTANIHELMKPRTTLEIQLSCVNKLL